MNRLSKKIDTLQARLNSLVRRAEKERPEQSELLREAFEEVQTALETLESATGEFRKQNEELVDARTRVEAERQRYRDLFEFAPDGYMVTDMNGMIQDANSAALKMLDVDRRFLLEKPLSDFIAATQRRDLQTLLTLLTQAEDRHEYAVTLRTHTGQSVEAELTVAPIRDLTDKTVGLRWLLRDITHNKRNRALHLVEERHRLIVENARDFAIFTIDLSGKIETWNPGAERLFGYLEAEAIGMPGARIFTPEDIEQKVPEREMQTALETGHALDERWHQRQDGSRFWASGFMHTLRDKTGTLQGFVKIVRDYTERREQQQHIEELNERLLRAMKETHQRVKNNLQIIAARIDMQVHQYPDIVPCEEVKQLGLQIRAMAAVHELLTRGAPDTEEGTRVSVQEILGTLTPLLQRGIEECRVQLQVQDMEIDSRRGTFLALVVNELVNNAVKQGGKNIRVNFGVADGLAALEVTDDGPGFSADFDAARSNNIGLELIEYLSRWDLGGKVEFLNRPKAGGQVIVTFPIDADTVRLSEKRILPVRE